MGNKGLRVAECKWLDCLARARRGRRPCVVRRSRRDGLTVPSPLVGLDWHHACLSALLCLFLLFLRRFPYLLSLLFARVVMIPSTRLAATPIARPIVERPAETKEEARRPAHAHGPAADTRHPHTHHACTHTPDSVHRHTRHDSSDATPRHADRGTNSARGADGACLRQPRSSPSSAAGFRPGPPRIRHAIDRGTTQRWLLRSASGSPTPLAVTVAPLSRQCPAPRRAALRSSARRASPAPTRTSTRPQRTPNGKRAPTALDRSIAAPSRSPLPSLPPASTAAGPTLCVSIATPPLQVD